MPHRKKYSFVVPIIVAVIIFPPLFIFQQIGWFDFWWWMSSNLVLLITLSALLSREYLAGMVADFSGGLFRKVLLGLASAALLYLVFLLGNYLSGFIVPNASSEVSGIYDFKGDASALRIFLLMLLLIGPGEELFWRGFVQERLMQRTGSFAGFLLATLIYTAVHVPTGNFMLIMAALVAGLFWGWMYLRFRSVAANVVSHVVWDISIFLLLPIG